MRGWINMCEDIATNNAEHLLVWAKANVPHGINFEAIVLDEDTIGIQWIERETAERGVAYAFLEALCQRADELSIWINLGVQHEEDDDESGFDDEDGEDEHEVPDYDQEERRDHNDLIRYYAGLGFEETEDDGEFTNMSRTPED